MVAPRVTHRGTGHYETYPGCDFTDDEREFLVAMERYRRARRRPYPTCREILAVLLSLGYRKPTADR